MSKYPTEDSALASPGEIYRHKKGGIYRRMFECDRGHFRTGMGDARLLVAKHSERLIPIYVYVTPYLETYYAPYDPAKRQRLVERHTIYEHLWPHEEGFWARPTEIFNEEDRFTLIRINK